eukprot:4384417-Pyramimonas_sp.AAC.1
MPRGGNVARPSAEQSSLLLLGRGLRTDQLCHSREAATLAARTASRSAGVRVGGGGVGRGPGCGRLRTRRANISSFTVAAMRAADDMSSQRTVG